jgi:hypothetical protein
MKLPDRCCDNDIRSGRLIIVKPKHIAQKAAKDQCGHMFMVYLQETLRPKIPDFLDKWNDDRLNKGNLINLNCRPV